MIVLIITISLNFHLFPLELEHIQYMNSITERKLSNFIYLFLYGLNFIFW